MVRVQVISEDAKLWQEVGARLRDVTIEVQPQFVNVRAACDAVVFAKDAAGLMQNFEQTLGAGKPLLLIGDRGHPWSDIASLMKSAQAARMQFAVANPERFLPSRQLIKQQIPEKIGSPGLVRLHRWTAGSNGHESLHDLDLVLWLVGSEPDRVFAVENQFGDSLIRQVHLGFPGGCMALLDWANGLPGSAGYSTLSVIGATGAAYADDHANMQMLFRGERAQALPAEEGIRQSVDLVSWFVDAVRMGRDLSEDLRNWERVFALRDGIGQSLARREAVDC